MSEESYCLLRAIQDRARPLLKTDDSYGAPSNTGNIYIYDRKMNNIPWVRSKNFGAQYEPGQAPFLQPSGSECSFKTDQMYR